MALSNRASLQTFVLVSVDDLSLCLRTKSYESRRVAADAYHQVPVTLRGSLRVLQESNINHIAMEDVPSFLEKGNTWK